MWAEITLAVVGCFVALGATWVVNDYPWPERVAANYATANHIPVPEGGLFISTGYAIPVLIALVAGAVMTFIAKRTRFGRYVYAIGGNPEAAELAGINTKKITVLVFALMGVLGGDLGLHRIRRASTRRPTRSARSTSSTSSPRRSSAAPRWRAASARSTAR